MIDVQQAEVSPMTPPAPANYVSPQGNVPLTIRTQSDSTCVQSSDAGEVVVCGRRQNDQYRLRQLKPPPVSPSLLSRPLRIQIAPGVSLGFQRGGGFGLRAKLGPGKKTDETER